MVEIQIRVRIGGSTALTAEVMDQALWDKGDTAARCLMAQQAAMALADRIVRLHYAEHAQSDRLRPPAPGV